SCSCCRVFMLSQFDCPSNVWPLYCGARPFRLPRTAAATKGTRPGGGRTAKLQRSDSVHDRRHVAAACWRAPRTLPMVWIDVAPGGWQERHSLRDGSSGNRLAVATLKLVE